MARFGTVAKWMAFVARVAWCLPFVLCFFPERIRDDRPKSPAAKVVHLLVDDSISMNQRLGQGGARRREVAASLAADAAAVCRDAGCEIKLTRLSDVESGVNSGADSGVAAGYSWIERGLNSWWMGLGADPWIVISDGGDSGQGGGAAVDVNPVAQGPGLIIGFQPADPRNLYFESVTAPPYAFDGRPAQVSVQVARGNGGERATGLPSETVQVQVRSGGQVLTAVDVPFKESEARMSARMVIPALPRGEQPLEFFILPSPDEVMVWDNSLTADVEVLPNTLGLLHLLGSPAWDGRFFRRMVKGEPKFDLISFFILRDPWDNLQVSDRELSLIPFPADRLFKDELDSFRVLVLQDFTLAQFLQPDYQQNLVQFVKNGGGLLFLGGPRALHRLDMSSSPLREILPFTPGAEAVLPYARSREAGDPLGDDPGAMPNLSGGFDGLGAGYDPSKSFTVEFANPSGAQRELASVFDDWTASAPDLRRMKGLKGLHVIPPALVDGSRVTTLLNARHADGNTTPLALASFPGRGRALWILSDSMWRMALGETAGVARETYDRFMMSGLQWLLRQDLRKPVVASRFTLRRSGVGSRARDKVDWSVRLSGPAVRHLNFLAATGDSGESRWRVSVCGGVLDAGAIDAQKVSADQYILSGTIPAESVSVASLGASLGTGLAGGSGRRGATGGRQFCKIEVDATDKAFGSVKALSSAFVQTPLPDSQALDSIGWLRKLQERSRNAGEIVLTGSGDPYESPESASARLGRWLRQHASAEEDVGADAAFAGAQPQPSRDDPYWPFRRWWAWALMGMMPVEVLLRRLRFSSR